MITMSVVGECFFWYRLTRVVPDKFHRAVKRLCECGTGHINLQLVDKFCYLGDMLSVDEMLMQLWRAEFEFDGINSGSWYHCLSIMIYH